MTISYWQGEAGDAYTQRNRVDWAKRIPFWKAIIEDLKPGSVLEVGCNAGWNLRAIRAVDPSLRLQGVEPNTAAATETQDADLMVWGFELFNLPVDVEFDLVATVGVLIHIPPTALPNMMREIVSWSNRYVLAVEYEAEAETEIPYRGEMGLLWKRPYGKLYEAMGLKVIHTCHLPPESGFDNCTYWLLEKPASL